MGDHLQLAATGNFNKIPRKFTFVQALLTLQISSNITTLTGLKLIFMGVFSPLLLSILRQDSPPYRI